MKKVLIAATVLALASGINAHVMASPGGDGKEKGGASSGSSGGKEFLGGRAIDAGNK